MKKGIKIVSIVIVSVLIMGLIGGGIAFFVAKNVFDAEEYQLGEDTVKSIKAVVAERTITSVSTEIHNGVQTKKLEYRSASVQEDLKTYIEYLTTEEDFLLLKDMDLSQSPSGVQLGKTASDPKKVIIMTIKYDSFGYIITLQKGEGTLLT